MAEQYPLMCSGILATSDGSSFKYGHDPLRQHSFDIGDFCWCLCCHRSPELNYVPYVKTPLGHSGSNRYRNMGRSFFPHQTAELVLLRQHPYVLTLSVFSKQPFIQLSVPFQVIFSPCFGLSFCVQAANPSNGGAVSGAFHSNLLIRLMLETVAASKVCILALTNPRYRQRLMLQ